MDKLKWIITLLLSTGLALMAFQQGWTESRQGRGLLSWLIVLLYMAFCLTPVLIVRARSCKHRMAAVPNLGSHTNTLVVFASQTGSAENLAWNTSSFLTRLGESVSVHALGDITAEILSQHGRVFFIVSTTGEGDAPDNAMKFLAPMQVPTHLPNLEYGLLALGDSSFTYFCAFGYQLDNWLSMSGAQPLFDLIEVDNGDSAALQHWHQSLAQLYKAEATPALPDQVFTPWRLSERRWLNQGSPGAPVFHLGLEWAGEGNYLPWQAGDIAEVQPCNDPAFVKALLERLGLGGDSTVLTNHGPSTLGAELAVSNLPPDQVVEEWRSSTPQEIVDRLEKLPRRDFSIASLPSEEKMQLLIRLVHQPSGKPGIGSGWLTQYAQLGDPILLRIRRNRNFHGPAGDSPMILIGNGTGIAGLRAHLVERIGKEHYRNWLIFGERTEACDHFYREELQGWQAAGYLQKVSFTFSRDNGALKYVQDALFAESEAFKTWVAAGAHVYLCGSLQGMSRDVISVIYQLLGDDAGKQLMQSPRFHKDVY